MTTTTKAGGSGNVKKTKTAKAPKEPKAKKPPKEKKPKPISEKEKRDKRAKLLDDKIVELSEAREELKVATRKYEAAKAEAKARKGDMEVAQAEVNQIDGEIVDIRNGNYQPMLPIMDKGTKTTKVNASDPAAQVTHSAPELPRVPLKLRILKGDVGTESAPMAWGDEIECTFEGGKVFGISLTTGNKIELDKDDYEVIAWTAPIAPEPGKEPWRAVELKTLPDIKPGLLELAAQAGLRTIGDVTNLEQFKKRLDECDGIGPGKAAIISDAIANYFKANPVDTATPIQGL